MVRRTPLLVLLFLFAVSSLAQAPAKKSQTKTKSTAVKSEESDPLEAQRKVVAVSLLTTLADEARSFRDLALRARVEARAADAFWDTDEEKARVLFRRAWEEAERVTVEFTTGPSATTAVIFCSVPNEADAAFFDDIAVKAK